MNEFSRYFNSNMTEEQLSCVYVSLLRKEQPKSEQEQLRDAYLEASYDLRNPHNNSE